MVTGAADVAAADPAAVPVIACRLCGSTELRSFLDLGATPPCELFLTAAAVEAPEPTYPLHVRVCEQLPARPAAAADHARGDVHRVRLLLLVLHVAGSSTPAGSSTARSSGSSSGPTRSSSRWPATTATCCSTSSSAASAAWASSRRSTSARPPGRRACRRSPRSSPRRPARQVRAEHGPADLVCLNNVYAHIPDVVGFTEGLRALVADDGWVSIEVQHLLTLVRAHPVRHRSTTSTSSTTRC